jgi:hypothetical protein
VRNTCNSEKVFKHNPYLQAPNYSFQWEVKDGPSYNDFGQQETRNGYDTQGYYHVLLPDGRIQRVSYSVNGDSGYVADVVYEGEAKYDSYKPAASYPSPSYAPKPAYYKPAYKPKY